MKIKLGLYHLPSMYKSKRREHSLATENFLNLIIQATVLILQGYTVIVYFPVEILTSLVSLAATEENDGKHCKSLCNYSPNIQGNELLQQYVEIICFP